MSDWFKLLNIAQATRSMGERSILFSIVATEGSSYRKLGAHLLVTESGRTAGSISAGCLENDLLQRVPEFFEQPAPQLIAYDNRGDEVFALNRGCSGSISVLVEHLDSLATNAIDCFAIAESERTQVALATIIEESDLLGLRLAITA